jgi:hypothetical protein
VFPFSPVFIRENEGLHPCPVNGARVYGGRGGHCSVAPLPP